MLSRVGRIFFNEYMLAMVLRTTPWSKSYRDLSTLLWLLLFVLCLLFLFHNFLSGRSADASECCSPDLYTDSFIPDFFSSMQNLYTFSITAPASSLYLHTSLAILLSEVVLNTSKHAFFCKYVKHETFLHLCESKKKALLGLEPSTLGSNLQLCFRIL